MTEITDAQVQEYLSGKVELVQLLGMAPDYVAKLRGRAQFFLDGGHHERALIMLGMLEELDRTDKLPTLLAIEVLLSLGRSDEAEAKVESLLARFPEDPEVVVAKAELHIAIGEMAPAAALLERIIAGDPDGQTVAGQRARAVAQRAYERIEAAR